MLPLDTAYSFIAARSPYLIAAVRLLDVSVIDGDHHTSDASAHVGLSHDLCLRETKPATVRATAAALVTALWRVARFHHERGEMADADTTAWNAASSALCFADAVDCLACDTDVDPVDMPDGYTDMTALRERAHRAHRRPTATPEWYARFITATKTRVNSLFLVPEDSGTRTTSPAGDTSRAGRVRETLRRDIAGMTISPRADKVPETARVWASEYTPESPGDVARRSRTALTARMATHARMFQATYRRRSRRGGNTELILPAYRPASSGVVVAVDVSGSMTDTRCRAAVNTLAGIAEETGNELDYFCVSSHTYPVHHFTGGDIVLDRDGAGTDMRACWEVFSKRPDDLAVVVTDGQTPWPASVGDVVVVIVAETVEAYRSAACDVPAGAMVVWARA